MITLRIIGLARSEDGKPQAFDLTRVERGLPAQVVLLALLVGPTKAQRGPASADELRVLGRDLLVVHQLVRHA